MGLGISKSQPQMNKNEKETEKKAFFLIIWAILSTQDGNEFNEYSKPVTPSWHETALV